MQLVIDLSLVLIIFIFSYAFGRKSKIDNQPVVPLTVTMFSLFIIIAIYILINIPTIINLMGIYG